jgi:hypothetical protein
MPARRLGRHHPLHDLRELGQDPSLVPDALDGRAGELGVAHSQPQLVLQLPARGLDEDEALSPRKQRRQRLHRERPQGEGTEEPRLHPPLPQGFHRPFRHAGRRVARNEEHFGVLAAKDVGALLAGGHLRVLPVEVEVVLLEVCLVEVDGADQVPAVRAVAPHRPIRPTRLDHLLRQLHLARHLSEVAVAQEDDRVAVLERELEGEHREVQHLLWVRGGEHDRVRVAMSEAAAGELDVGLLGSDVAEAGAAAHHVDEDARHLRPDHVGDPLEHQAEAR